MRTGWKLEDGRGRVPGVAVYLGALMLIAGMGAGCASSVEPDPPSESPRNVRVLVLKPQDLEEFFQISGPMLPVRGTDVSAEEGGTVTRLPHDKGDRVAAGDVLVELDRRLLAAQVRSASASVELSAYNAEQTDQLHQAGKVSRIQAMTARTQAEQAQANLDMARIRYERAAVKAPFRGLMAQRYVELGQLVAPGQPVARVVDPYSLKLSGALTEREVAWCRRGAPAEVHVSGYERPVTGQVSWVALEADPHTGRFGVEVHVENPRLDVRPGVLGRAVIHKRTHHDVLVIPRDAVLETRVGNSVYVVEQGRARRRRITLGADQGLMVVVVSGLAAGDRLVVRGHRDLVEDAPVRITETAEARDGGMAGDPAEVREESTLPRGVEEGAAP